MDILDKLFSFSSNKFKESPFMKNLPSLQGLLRDSSNMFSQIPFHEQQFLIENHLLADFDASIEKSDYYQQPESLLGVINKMFSMSTFNSNQRHNFPRFSEIDVNRHLLDHKIDLVTELFAKKHFFKSETDVTCSVNSEIPVNTTSAAVPNINTSMNCSNNTQKRVPIPKGALTSDKKQAMCDTFSLDKELADRKTKKLQKRSRKRRKRQKKGATRAVDSPNHSCPTNLPTKSAKEPVTKQTSNGSDILCDIVATGMQIILPSISSFLICVDSSGEEESEFEVNSDIDCLADFEMSGLFVTNLMSSIPRAECAVLQLGDEYDADSLELSERLAALRNVNRSWQERTKDLDCKPRQLVKVSFAPDSQLVDIVLVEMYDRKGEWEQYARDRHHFQQRIRKFGEVIAPYLTQQHRTKVFSNLSQDTRL